MDDETYVLLNELARGYDDNASQVVRDAIWEKAEREGVRLPDDDGK